MKPTSENGSTDGAQSSPVDIGGDGRWYAVHTQPHRELRATIQLENQSFRVFLPRRLKTVRHARNLNRQAWRCVNGTFGVTSLVMQGDMPHPAPRGVVEAMLASVDAAGLLCLEENLKVGSHVRLAAGPFADKLGILERLDDSGRVRVLLEIMGGTVPVHIERRFITAA